jgi:hypothetical protein
MAEPTFSVMTDRIDRPVAGVDTTILTMPTQFYVTIGDGPPALAVRQFIKAMRDLAEGQAAALGEELHHAEFVITADPVVVEARGALHDCEDCRAGVRRALRSLRENPGQEMVVGTLYWAAPLSGQP